MKNINLLITAALASVVVSTTSAFAAAPESGTAAKLTKPVVSKVVAPTELSREYRNVTVKLSLTIDEKGVPHDVTPVGWMDGSLAARLLPAVHQWRFTPAFDADGKPVETRVILPLTLVEA